jgi:hypothetical protein
MSILGIRQQGAADPDVRLPGADNGGSAVKEKVIERKLRRAIERAGGTCEKFKSPARCFVPDRLCSLRKGVVFFVETKKPDGTLESGQERDHARRRARGFRVYVIDSYSGVEAMILAERKP